MNVPTPNASAASPRLRAVLTVLLVNAVPLIGIHRYGWSAANVLVLYWFENLLIAVCTCIRLLVHRRLTRKKGYWRRRNRFGIEVNGAPVKTGPIGEYATGAFAFTLAHGVFVAVIVMILAQNHPDEPMWQVSLSQVGRGAAAIAAMLGAELLVDLSSIRARSFAAMKDYAQGRMSRIVVLHLAIIFGMLAMAVSGSPFGVLYVLIGLKTLVELGAALARSRGESTDAAPPAWMLKAADRLAKDKGGAAGLIKQMQHDREAAKEGAIEDEEPMPAASR
jgi:hypothetical protein